MSDTPTFDEVEKEIKESKVPVQKYSSASVSIIGCGGAGKHTVSKFKQQKSYPIEYFAVDTADGDISQMNIPTHIINGDGSGKVKATNVDAINKAINTEIFDSTKSNYIEPKDINIVVFSLSGGSGSLIGPMLIKELHRRNKVVVAIAIADSMSELDANNTYKTLLSIEHMIKTNNIYLPIMLFDNKVGRPKVDITINHRLNYLVSMLTMKADEVDRNDKINFFKPDKTIGSPARLAGCFICSHEIDHDDMSGEIVISNLNENLFDAIMYITPDAGNRLDFDTRSIFFGINPYPIDKNDEYCCLLGFDILDDFVATIESSIAKYKTIGKESKEYFKQDNEYKSHNSGMFI
jgi:hypothetical protein